MKKIYAVNGSPRKNGNTAQLLKKALEGAASVGAEVKFIQLADLNFSGLCIFGKSSRTFPDICPDGQSH